MLIKTKVSSLGKINEGHLPLSCHRGRKAQMKLLSASLPSLPGFKEQPFINGSYHSSVICVGCLEEVEK